MFKGYDVTELLFVVGKITQEEYDNRVDRNEGEDSFVAYLAREWFEAMKKKDEGNPERVEGEKQTRLFVEALLRESEKIGDSTDAALWKVLLGVEDSFEFFDLCGDLARRMWT